MKQEAVIGFDFATMYHSTYINHVVYFFGPCRMRCSIRENDGGHCEITFQRGSKHGRRYEFASTFEDARRRVTQWVRRNARDYA